MLFYKFYYGKRKMALLKQYFKNPALLTERRIFIIAQKEKKIFYRHLS